MEQSSQSIPMEKTTGKIIRTSLHSFLKSYQYFTSTSVLLLLPFSASILLSQALIPSMSPLFLPVHARLQSLFDSSGFMLSSHFFSPLNFKLSQTISSSIVNLPFALSSLLIAKAATVHGLRTHKKAFPSSFLSLYKPLLLTHLCNSFVFLSVHAAGFFLLLFIFHALDALGLSSFSFLLFVSAFGVVVQSIVVANALVTCNLALVVAGMENCSGYFAILKACVLIKGRVSTALSLVLPINLGLSALEALFQYRVMRAYRFSDEFTGSMALEGLMIAYLYSIVIVVDTIATCTFYKSCKGNFDTDGPAMDPYRLLEEESGASTDFSISHHS